MITSQSTLVGLRLPPIQRCPKKFMMDVFSEKKKLMVKSGMRPLEIPNYAEFTAEKLYAIAIKDDFIRIHLPEP